MDLNELFRLPPRSGIAAFAEAQVHLYRRNVSLQDYFLPLQLNFGRPCSDHLPEQSVARRSLHLASAGAYRIVRPVGRRKFKADVLYCPTPYFSRATENRFLVDSLMGLVQTGATVLCLLPGHSPCRAEIESRLSTEGRSGQVTLIDPLAALNPIAVRLLPRAARDRCRLALAEIIQILLPLGITTPYEPLSAFEDIAMYVEMWSSIEGMMEFDAVVARCHWLGLCSPVCRTALERGKPVITFQQGVIDHTLDVPVTASKFVAFGNSSARFLSRMNLLFHQAVGRAGPAVDFIPGGCLFDTVWDLPNQFENRTVLVLDDSDPNGFYGLDLQQRGGLQLARTLLQSGPPLRRVIVRLHPYTINTDLEPWKELVREFPNSCELSHSAWTLQEDLKRASVVVGNISGALTVAAASGLPTLFLESDSYATKDLDCFRPGQTFPPDGAYSQIRSILSDLGAYTDARTIALRNAREYYANGTNLNLNGEFFEKMLRDNRLSSAPVSASSLRSSSR
jgi:hypothetical protein